MVQDDVGMLGLFHYSSISNRTYYHQMLGQTTRQMRHVECNFMLDIIYICLLYFYPQSRNDSNTLTFTKMKVATVLV